MGKEKSNGCVTVSDGDRVLIPVNEMEFTAGGNTIWVQAAGGTVLRIKCKGKIKTSKCSSNPVSHTDIIVDGDIEVCLSKDATTN